ncbi:MAG TPA: 4-hydroxy-tetrahydrodipicolinate reductase [Oculatellaceae cyanobacterium]
MSIRVCLAGISGWTGKSVAEGVLRSSDLELVCAVARKSAGQDVGLALGVAPTGVKVSATLDEALVTPADVLIDYTSATAVKSHVWSALAKKMSVVVGSSGLTADDYAQIEAEAKRQGVGVIACGNFAITAALAKHFAVLAAKYVPHFEIIDYAHEHKPDAPSGTGRELAEAIAHVQRNQVGHPIDQIVGSKEARGAQIDGTPVHSIRLPSFHFGFETIFGLPDERLRIQHEAGAGAGPYVAGTLLAVRKVQSIKGLIRGMDTLLFGS